MNATRLAALVAVFVLATAVTARAQLVYWTDYGSFSGGFIGRFELPGTTAITKLIIDIQTGVHLGLDHPEQLVADSGHDQLFWSARTNPGFDIYTANLDGSHIRSILHDVAPSTMALDTSRRRIYWADAADNKIHSANYDGSGVVDVLTNITTPSIAIDPARGYLYWTDNQMKRIMRSEPDGQQITVVINDTGDPQAAPVMTLDWADNVAYWFNRGASGILRGNLSTGDVSAVTQDPAVGPSSLAVDHLHHQLYFISGTPITSIQRINTDGSSLQRVLDPGTESPLIWPQSVALESQPVPEPSTLVLAALGGLGLLSLAIKRTLATD